MAQKFPVGSSVRYRGTLLPHYVVHHYTPEFDQYELARDVNHRGTALYNNLRGIDAPSYGYAPGSSLVAVKG